MTQQQTTPDYEEYIHTKLQEVRYKYNYLLQLMNSTGCNGNDNDNMNSNSNSNSNSNNQNLNNLHLEILKLELDNLDFKLDEFIFEYDGFYPKEKYQKMEENYLQMMGDKLKEFYQEEQKKNKQMVMKTLLPMLLQIMMLSDKDSIYHTKNNEKGVEEAKKDATQGI